MSIWLPFCVADPIAGCSGAGSYTGGAPKLLWHTTEGGSYAGARSTYEATHNLPQITADITRLVAYQHLPLDVAATALVHNGGATNTDHVIQVEIVGFCTEAPNWSAAQYAFLADLARHIEAATGVPRACGVAFIADAAKSANGVRLTWDAWHAYAGHLGHQHAPENYHGDPGALRIDLILHTSPSPPPIGGADMACRTFLKGSTADGGPEFAFIPGRGAVALGSQDEKRWLVAVGLVVDGPPLELAPVDFVRWFGNGIPSTP